MNVMYRELAGLQLICTVRKPPDGAIQAKKFVVMCGCVALDLQLRTSPDVELC